MQFAALHCSTIYIPYHLCLTRCCACCSGGLLLDICPEEGRVLKACSLLLYNPHHLCLTQLCLLQRWPAVGYVPGRGQSAKGMQFTPSPLHHWLQSVPFVSHPVVLAAAVACCWVWQKACTNLLPLHHNQCCFCLTNFCMLQRWHAVGYVPGRGQSAKGMQHWVGRCLQRCQT